MDNLLLNPGPTNTLDCVKRAQIKGSDVCHRTQEFLDLLLETKKNLLSRFSSSASFKIWEIAMFSGSGTAAMESLISSLLSKTTVIVAGKYGKRAADMMSLYSVTAKKIDCATKDELKTSNKKDNLYFVENETTTGEKFDLKTITTLYPNSRLFIDATSAFGATDYTEYLDNIDAVSFCSNKCLQSTPGLGVVIWRKTLSVFDKSFYLSLNKYKDNSLPFTLPVQCVAALNSALNNSKTPEKIMNARKNRLIGDFSEMGIQCLNKYPSNSIIGFRHPIKSYEELRDFLKEKNIVIYDGIEGIENSFRVATMSVEFDRSYGYLLRSFRDSCIC